MVTSSGDSGAQQAMASADAEARAVGRRRGQGPGPRLRWPWVIPIVVAVLIIAYAVWAIGLEQPPDPLPRAVDRVEVVRDGSTVVLSWEADRCERLDDPSSARVEGSRLVLDVITVTDGACATQVPLGTDVPATRWSMVEVLPLDGDVADRSEGGEVTQAACEDDQVDGCDQSVSWVRQS